MKSKILDINGKEKGSIDLPKEFSAVVRNDIIAKVVETQKVKQPYAPSPVGGKQHSASGKIHHLRHVWKSGYGRGASRMPRKIMSRRGSQFNWVAAEVPNARGGRRAHPPKIIAMINVKRINKKEMVIAMASALSATGNEKIVSQKYERLNGKKLSGLPIVVESKLVSLKTKELLSSLQKVLGETLFEVAVKKRSVRAGIGKLRGRKYKKNAGLLIVVGDDEKLKTNIADVKNAKALNVTDLANGGAGRLTIYTEKAIKNLGERLK
jgi:large subunit ribosomal protein L4e